MNEGPFSVTELAPVKPAKVMGALCQPRAYVILAQPEILGDFTKACKLRDELNEVWLKFHGKSNRPKHSSDLEDRNGIVHEDDAYEHKMLEQEEWRNGGFDGP